MPIVRIVYKKVRHDVYSEDKDNWYTEREVIPKNEAKVIHIYANRNASRIREQSISGD